MRTEPHGPKEGIIDETITFVQRRLRQHGLEAEHVFVTFATTEKDAEGDNAASGYYAEGDEENLPDLLAFLLAQAKGIGDKLGLSIVLLDGRGKRMGHD